MGRCKYDKKHSVISATVDSYFAVTQRIPLLRIEMTIGN
jgi:hypothetical protein